MATVIEALTLSSKEKYNLKKFKAEHRIYCADVANNYNLLCSSTNGIGVAITAVCKCCNKKYDITDYSTW